MGYLQNAAIRDEKECSEQKRVTSLYEIIEEIGDRVGGHNDELLIATTLSFLQAGKALWLNPPSLVDLNEFSELTTYDV